MNEYWIQVILISVQIHVDQYENVVFLLRIMADLLQGSRCSSCTLASLPYFLDKTPGRQSTECVLRARRQKDVSRQFEHWIMQASRTYYVHSTRRQNEQRRLTCVGRLIEESCHYGACILYMLCLLSIGVWWIRLGLNAAGVGFQWHCRWCIWPYLISEFGLPPQIEWPKTWHFARCNAWWRTLKPTRLHLKTLFGYWSGNH